MDVVVITRKETGGVVAVVENPGSMSTKAVGLAWAKSQGMRTFPKDCRVTELPLTTYGMVQRRLTPIHELNKLELEAADTD